MDTKNTNCVIYVRVSSKEQAEEGYSIESQQQFLRQYALEKGLSIVKEFVESESAKVKGRPIFNEMVSFIKRQKQVKTILCEKTDRLYRNFTDHVALDIDQQGLTVILAKEGETLSKDSKSHQKLVHGLKVLLAKNYTDNLSEESIKGLLEKARQGEYPQQAPTGYINNTETKRIEVDRARAPFVRKMFEYYSSGEHSLEKAKELLRKEGLTSRTGKPLSKSQVDWMLKNPIYYGDFRWRGVLYKGIHEPIISKELFDRVQRQFQSLNRPKYRKHDFAYSGLLTCAKCGCGVTAEIKKGKYIYYHCTGFKGKCSSAYISQEDLEKQFASIVKRTTISDKHLNWYKEALLESHEDEKEYHNEVVAKLTQEIAQLQDWTDKAYQDKLRGVINEQYWLKVSTEWANSQTIAIETLKKHQNANKNYLETGIRILEWSNKAYSMFKVRKSHEKRELLNTVLSNCTLDGKSVVPTYKKPFDILVKGSSCSNHLRD
ncbi:MAG: hypothetical protein A2270_01100 [Elusimicrobia bacterium RIFOXYA12_FULL_51_18]|nr:MAG: hypothetical protein A2270_01100 [Elusimicrobia bacterium RIFOXYA12_FULL_51_18]OGS31100.1 MAG: hypothetical protein A2218_02035 [Elusimicrobia bacterium RIFOXYA2_FULL_53_38]